MTLLELFREHWKLLLASFVVGLVAFLIMSVTQDPIYRATLTAMPADPMNEQASAAQGVSGLLGIGSFLGAGADNSAETLATLESRSFIEAFIEQQQIVDEIARAAGFTTSDREDLLWDAHQYFLGDVLHVTQDAATRIVTIMVDWTDPTTAANWANLLVELLNETIRQRTINDAASGLGYLQDELEQTSIAEVREQIYALMQSRIETQMLASVRPDYALRIIDPAAPPNKNDIERPKTFLMTALGAVLGLMTGLALVVVRQLRLPVS